MVADSHLSRQNGGNRENEDPQIVVLDHAKMERKQVPEQSEFEHAAPAYAKKEQIALTSKFSTKIQQKELEAINFNIPNVLQASRDATKGQQHNHSNISVFSCRSQTDCDSISEFGKPDKLSGVEITATIIKTNKTSEVENGAPDLKDYSCEHWIEFYPMFIDYRKLGGVKTLDQLISNAHLKKFFEAVARNCQSTTTEMFATLDDEDFTELLNTHFTITKLRLEQKLQKSIHQTADCYENKQRLKRLGDALCHIGGSGQKDLEIRILLLRGQAAIKIQKLGRGFISRQHVTRNLSLGRLQNFTRAATTVDTAQEAAEQEPIVVDTEMEPESPSRSECDLSMLSFAIDSKAESLIEDTELATEVTGQDVKLLEADREAALTRVEYLEGQLDLTTHRHDQSSQAVHQLGMTWAALPVSQDMKTRLGDMESLLGRVTGMDSGLVKQSSLLEATLADEKVAADMITAQHGDGEPYQSLLDDRTAMEYGDGGLDDEAMLQAKWDYCKRIRKKRLMFEGRLIVQPA